MCKLLFLSIFLFATPLMAEQTKTKYNPFTGKPDFITVVSSNTLADLLVLLAGTGTAGACLQTDGGTPPIYSWGSCTGGAASTVVNFALLEDNTFILLEGGLKMLLEH